MIILSTVSAADWNLCGSGDEAIFISEVLVNPDPIQAGTPALFHFNATQKPGVKVFEGTLHASVKYFGVKVFQKSGDLCSAVNCPLLPGPAILDFQESMPGFLPPGKMVLTLEASRNDRLPLFCVDIELSSNKKKDAVNGGGTGNSIRSVLGLQLPAFS